MNHTIQLPDDFQLVRKCSEKELQDHLSYLRVAQNKPTGGWYPPVPYHWYIVRIRSLATFGNLKTFWKWGTDWPSVKEVLPLLQSKDYDDNILQIISEYREGLGSGEYTLKLGAEGKSPLTLVCTVDMVINDKSYPLTMLYTSHLIIHDGNKHAVAYYENMKAENRQDINLELFFLTPIELHL